MLTYVTHVCGFFLCFGAWSLSLADPPLVCDARALLSHVDPCSLSALGRHQAALSFPSSLLTRGLGVLICKAGRIAEQQGSATLCGKDSALAAQSARPLSCVCHCALAVGFWPRGPGRIRAGPPGAGASPAQGALGSASRCEGPCALALALSLLSL